MSEQKSDILLLLNSKTNILSNDAPAIRIIKSTPDFIWLEWDNARNVRLSDIEFYKLKINGEIKTFLPSTEYKLVVNDGIPGKRYIFQLEMIRKSGKTISSIPLCIDWPGVTIPKCHVFVNGGRDAIVSWGDSTSINDGDIESYTLYLYDSNDCLLNTFGPYSAECRQVWIKNLTAGIYYSVLEIKLANSNQSLYSKSIKIQCGKKSIAPVLSCDYTNSNNRKQLINIIHHLINIHDNIKSEYLLEKCKNQLKHILLFLTALTDSVHLNLIIESKTNDLLRNYQLIVDDQESILTIPGFERQFSLELPHREKPYQLSLAVISDLYETKSNKIQVEASGFTFFCAHFNQQQPIKSCSYMQTFRYEQQIKRSIHQGLLKSPQIMNNIQVYDLNENQIIRLPLSSPTHRMTILLFYINECIPSKIHLNYLSTYASVHRTQYNFMSINCNQDNIDDLKKLTKDYKDIRCYTDFSSEEFRYEQNENGKPLYELLSIDGVPTYFILDFSSRIIWKGRFCIQNQFEYNEVVDHTLAEINQIHCSMDNCKICRYHSMNNTYIELEFTKITKKFQSIVQQRLLHKD